MANVLILLTEERLSARIESVLQPEGHVCLRAESPSAACQLFADGGVDLAILDARLQWAASRELFRLLLGTRCPVLFLTDDKAQTPHLIAIYQCESDVIVYPFARGNLVRKCRLLLAKTQQGKEVVGALYIDEKKRIALVDGQKITLTAQEFALLSALLKEADMPVSREKLLRTAWGYQSMGETRTVDVHIQRLRKKLGCDRIETVYKCGYRLKLA